MKRIFVATLVFSLLFVVTAHVQADSSAGLSVTPSGFSVLVDGEAVEIPFYDIGGRNFFRLRDIAYVLNETGARFIVGWDGAINTVFIVSQQAYISRGDELISLSTEVVGATPATASIFIDGEAAELTAYLVNDSHFVMPHELGAWLGYHWYFDQEQNAIVIRTKPPQLLNDGMRAIIDISLREDEWYTDMMTALSIFMDRYPNITVEPRILSYEYWWELTMLNMAAGIASDIIFLDHDKLQLVAYDWDYVDLFYDLHKLSHILDLSELPQEWLDLMTVDGILAAVPMPSSADTFGGIPKQGFAIFGYTDNPELSAYLLNFLINNFFK